MIYYYSIKEQSEDKFKLAVNNLVIPDENRKLMSVAHRCAEDFHGEHDGYECSWPLTFVLFNDEQTKLGEYEVELESAPVFSVRRK